MSPTVGCLWGMIQEREPLRAADLPSMLGVWVQDVGGFAAVGLAFWFLLRLIRRAAGHHERHWTNMGFLVGFVGAAVAYLAALFFLETAPNTASACTTIAGLFAVTAVGLPFFRDLFRLRPRRVWGLAVLSIKEGIHHWALWGLLPFVLVLLVAPWFVPSRADARLSLYVQIVYKAMTLLLLVTAALLAAFSIPADVRAQTISTVVTKPVERFEIALGRFLGYVLLMTGILGAMALASLLFAYLTGIAVEPRARVPVYAAGLQFQGKQAEFEGLSRGSEWEYRRYIAGGVPPPHSAVWLFTETPTQLDQRGRVPCEFQFDIFRYHRAEKEGQGVVCSFTFATRHRDPRTKADYDRGLTFANSVLTDASAFARAVEELKRENVSLPERPSPEEVHELLLDRLAEKHGWYEVLSKEITDARTYAIDVPAGLFRNALRGDSGPGPLFGVEVKCNSPGQLVGMARGDLYFVDAEGLFGLNFIKGALGLWFRLCLVIGVAVACSTYLSGVISLVTTLFLIVAGMRLEYIRLVAAGKNDEGGPLKALQGILGQATPGADVTPVGRVTDAFDEAFRWYLSRFLTVLPDVDLYSLTDFVAQGFDLSPGDLGLRLLVLAGYLLPWAVVAYYLLKSREVAA